MGLSSTRTAMSAGLVVALLATLLLAPAPAAAPHELRLRLKLAEFDPLQGLPQLPDRLRLASEPEAGYFVAQFSRPIDPGLLDTIRATDARGQQVCHRRPCLHEHPDVSFGRGQRQRLAQRLQRRVGVALRLEGQSP